MPAGTSLVKSSSDKAMDNALIPLLGSLVALPLLLVVGWPPAAAWPFILASAVIHLGYYTALTGAYKHGDLGLTYPLMRGTAPLLVALSATLTLGETLSPLSWAGVLGVCCGVLALGLSRHALDSPRAVAFALANAVVIAAVHRGRRPGRARQRQCPAVRAGAVRAQRLAFCADRAGPPRRRHRMALCAQRAGRSPCWAASHRWAPTASRFGR